MMPRLALALLATLQLHAAFAAESVSVRAHYAVIKAGLQIGTIDETYTRSQDRYTLQSVARPSGIVALFRPGKINIDSSGTITPAGLQPQEFSYRMEGEARKDNSARFDWNTSQLTLNHDGTQTRLALPEGTQDRLSAMYQFMFVDLAGRKEVRFAMTNGRKLDDYRYQVSSSEKYAVGTALLDTWYLDSGARAGETRTQLWLAKSRRNLPCKLIITDPDGDKLTQELRALDVLP